MLARRHAEATTESEEKAKEARGQRETNANNKTRAKDGQTSSRSCTLNDSVSMVVSGLVHLISDLGSR